MPTNEHGFQKMKIHIERANAGTLLDIGGEIWAAHSAGETWTDSMSQVLVDRIIQRYRGHIAAALRANGVELADTDTLDGETLLRIINERSGLDIQAWNVDAVKTALDTFMAARLSDALGVQVDSVQDVDAIKQSLMAAAADAVQSGRANAFISRAMIKKIRVAKAWNEGGVPVDDRRKTLSRWYQKKFRRSHVAVWR